MNVRQRRALQRRLFSVALGLALAATGVPPSAFAASTPLVAPIDPSGYCATAHTFAYVDGLDGSVAPCALPTGAFVLGALYLQNASRIGGTALAAYPLVSLRVGVLPRLQLTASAPSAIAQSDPGGGGSFPVTHAGYGLSYTVAQSARAATALVAAALPPDSRFAASHTQARYVLGMTSDLAVSQKLTLGATASGTSSQRNGLGMVLPSLDASAGFAPTSRTQFVADLGERIVTRHAVAQSFGDAAINHVLDKKLLLTIGVGTTFNNVNNSKPHYLASGLTYRP